MCMWKGTCVQHQDAMLDRMQTKVIGIFGHQAAMRHTNPPAAAAPQPPAQGSSPGNDAAGCPASRQALSCLVSLAFSIHTD